MLTVQYHSSLIRTIKVTFIMCPQTLQNRQKLIHAIESEIPSLRYSYKEIDKINYSHDLWPRTLLSRFNRRPSVAPPLLIVWPQSKDELIDFVKLVTSLNISIVPRGGGSGVCGGAMAIKESVMVDLKSLRKLHSIDPLERLVDVDAGIIGQHLEDRLNQENFSLGHFPASLSSSTLGGWLSTRSAGQCSSLYGKIEDIVHEIEFITPSGECVITSKDDSPALIELIIGSEGTLGIITRAKLHINELPQIRIFRAYRFDSEEKGLKAMREIVQSGLKPSVMRLYDKTDTLINGLYQPSSKHASIFELHQLFSTTEKRPASSFQYREFVQRSILKQALKHRQRLNKIKERILAKLSFGSLLIIGHEGLREFANDESLISHQIIIESGAKDLGDAPAIKWFKQRYDISFKQSQIFAAGGFVDTFEVATLWSKLPKLYQELYRTLSEEAFVMAHFSHAYHEGCSIYFTVAAADKDPIKTEQRYDRLWNKGLITALKHGATISHHHGVGYSKSKFVIEEFGNSIEFIRKIKHASDPFQIFNPQKLGLS